MIPFTTSGCSSRNAVRTMRWVVTYSPVGPQVGLVDEHVGAALLDEAGGPGLGHPGAVDVAGDEGGEGVAVGLRLDRHVAAAGVVGLVALVLQPGAQGDVLGVAELRGGERRALEVLGGVDALAHDEERAARGAARHDADGRAVGLGVGVDGRVRAR